MIHLHRILSLTHLWIFKQLGWTFCNNLFHAFFGSLLFKKNDGSKIGVEKFEQVPHHLTYSFWKLSQILHPHGKLISFLGNPIYHSPWYTTTNPGISIPFSVPFYYNFFLHWVVKLDTKWDMSWKKIKVSQKMSFFAS